MTDEAITKEFPENPPKVGDPAGWPRITVVTAVRNGARYLEETIRSVIYQGYPNLEYIIVDGLSTDGTLDIIRKYEAHLAWWVSQADRGVYDALNTGFAKSTGEIMGWLNAGDKLHTNGLYIVGSVFASFRKLEWITGRPTLFNDEGMTVKVMGLPRWSRFRYLAEASHHVQQESTYWRRELWLRAGGALNATYRDVGDSDLWVRFFRHAELHTVDALIGGYRHHPGSISHSDIDGFNRRCDEIIGAELNRESKFGVLKFWRRITQQLERIRKVRGAWRLFGAPALRWLLYHAPGHNCPSVIKYKHGRWQGAAR
jgi:glycosyltransferase involved in cell wall biosynthesis